MLNNFDCKNMPAEVKAVFFDSYRQPNNTTVIVYVAEERQLVKNWLLANGANEEDDVTISYHWTEEEAVEKFIFEGENADDDDDDGEEEPVIKIKKSKKRIEETIEESFDIPLDLPKEDILVFEDETEIE